jgi:Ni,Fe-hydrogenase III large subunit
MKMNNMLENHPRDTRSPDEKEENIIDLNILQDVLEESIGSYAIKNPQNIYDEEFEQILRFLEFSRGLKNHQVVIAPDGIIRFLSPKFPSKLLLEIHNALVGIVVFDAPEENQ